MESDIIQALQTISDNIQAASQPGWIEYLTIAISFFGVVLSVVAVIFAACVPKKIADRQDKIALFDKRIQCLKGMLTIVGLSDYINKHTSCYRDVILAFRIFLDFPEISDRKKHFVKNLSNYLLSFQTDAMSGEYLFDNFDAGLVEKACDIVQELIIKLTIVDNDSLDNEVSEEMKKQISDLFEICADIQSNMIPSIEKVLQIKAD